MRFFCIVQFLHSVVKIIQYRCFYYFQIKVSRFCSEIFNYELALFQVAKTKTVIFEQCPLEFHLSRACNILIVKMSCVYHNIVNIHMFNYKT